MLRGIPAHSESAKKQLPPPAIQSSAVQIFRSISVVTWPFRPILVTDAGLMPAFSNRSFFFIFLSMSSFQSFLTHRHKNLLRTDIQKCSAAWQSIRSIAAILPRPIPTHDSVVCNDSIFGQRKQENDRSARIPTPSNFFLLCERNS